MECYLQQYIFKNWKQQLFIQPESNPLQKYFPKTKNWHLWKDENLHRHQIIKILDYLHIENTLLPNKAVLLN